MGIFEKITSEYECHFDQLLEHHGKTVIAAFSNKLYLGFCKLYSQANYLTYIEWVLRHFQASKKLMLAALFFTETEFLLERKVRNLSLYGMYYSLFNAFWSNVILLPYSPLPHARFVSHKSLFNIIPDLRLKYHIYDEGYIQLFNRLRLSREAYSYRLPLSGNFVRKEDKSTLNVELLATQLSKILPIVLQASELISYLSFYAWNKKVGEVHDEQDNFQEQSSELFFSFLEIHDHLGKYCLIDDDDYYRQSYVLKNFKSPFPLSWVVTGKLCEDLECNWDWNEDGSVSKDDFDINEVRSYITGCIG